LLALVAVTLTIVLHAGCSEPTRYHVLSFFFDGVPPPAGFEHLGPQTVMDEWGEQVPIDDPRAQAILQRQAQVQEQQVEAQKVFFYHAPYRDRECFGCHDREGDFQPPDKAGELCQRCHTEYFTAAKDDWIHGPTLLGECRRCHEPHKSEHDSLLTSKQPELCVDCHDPQYVEQDPYHAAVDHQQCSRCHDPHATGNRLLLVDSRTFSRRNMPLLPASAGHAAWTRQDCNLCHSADQSNVLLENVNAVCTTCHMTLLQSASAQSTHEAVREGNCTTCHTPHRSTREHLIRPLAERVCYSCHKPEELQTPEHPNVTRADCLLCHGGHQTDRVKLLRPGVAMLEPSPAQASESDTVNLGEAPVDLAPATGAVP
jgi:predicted CXXCH cytochrome family protein